MQVMPTVDPGLCDGCGQCVAACHGGAIVPAEGKVKILETKECDYCGVCEAVCTQHAITCCYIIVSGEE